MPEEKKNADPVDGGGKSAAKEDILPLFFTSKTQQIFECRADEDVNTDNPYKLIQKEAILQDFKERAAISDFHPAKKIVLVSAFYICSLSYNMLYLAQVHLSKYAPIL